ncbi:MAG TPA: hypothetical protein VNM14_07285 [Planctomycetota bacterium]|jgi:hypothetical protein|nr:hypothetical protein [Planctomycetota bacterium]
MKELRAYVFVLMGTVFGLVWSGGCYGPLGNSASPARKALQSAPASALLTFDVPDGVTGGPNTGGAWTTRPLNTEVYDPSDIVALSANQFTLGPGTYVLQAGQTFFQNVDNQKSFRGRLRNITSGTTVALSLSVRLHEGPSESATIECPIPRTLLTLTAPASFELQYYCQNADASTNGLGWPMLTGENERYAYVSIERIN